MLCSSDRTPVTRVVVFDLDDTLYLERDYVLSGLAAVDRWVRAQLGLIGLEGRMLARFAAGERSRLFDLALADFGHFAEPQLIARMLTVYRQHSPRIVLAPDAREVLADPPRDTAFAIITDGFLQAQKRKLRALGLHRRGVRIAICTDRWGREAWKPAPRAFQYVQAAFGLPAEQMSYVADNPAKDFHAPMRLGWRTIRIARTGGLHRHVPNLDVVPERLIADLREL